MLAAGKRWLVLSACIYVRSAHTLSTPAFVSSAERFRMATLRRSECWRRCLGLCCICGQPMASPQFRSADGRVLLGPSILLKNNNNGRKNTNTTSEAEEEEEEGDEEEGGVAAIDSDGRLLTEENPLLQCLMRFNARGEMQYAHVIDDYTFLEGRRNGSPFRKEFETHAPTLLATNPKALGLFKGQVIDAPDQRIYATAVTTMRRVVESLTVPSCRRCNKAMDREAAHVLATYRCFEATRHSEVAALEGTDRKAIAAKKVLQQIALYFEPRLAAADGGGSSSEIVGWAAKSEDRLLRDAALWRCIAHLWNWGRAPPGGGVRFRMIATFHAAHHIFLTSGLQGVMPLDVWHVHVWRPFCMARFGANTFLGMRQGEVADAFDLMRRDRAADCERALRLRLGLVADALALAHAAAGDEVDDLGIERVWSWQERMTAAGVVDELGLLRFMAAQPLSSSSSSGKTKQKKGRDVAMREWLAYFRYNLSGGAGAHFFLRQCDALERNLVLAAAGST